MIIWNIQSLLLLLCKFGRLRKLCSMTQCFWQCFYALQLRISAGMAIISDSVNNNRTSPTMWLLTLCFFNKKTGIVFYAFGDFFFFFSIFSCFFPFFSISLQKPPEKHFCLTMQKFPPPHTPSPQKKPLFVVMMFSCKLKLWLEVFSLNICCYRLVTAFLVEFQCDFIILLLIFQFFFFLKVKSVILF